MKDGDILFDSDIQNESTLHLVLNLFPDQRMKIYINNFTKAISLEVDPENTIDVVKQKIQDQEGIPVDQQRCFILGKELFGGCTLFNYGVKNEDTIFFIRNKKKEDIDETSDGEHSDSNPIKLSFSKTTEKSNSTNAVEKRTEENDLPKESTEVDPSPLEQKNSSPKTKSQEKKTVKSRRESDNSDSDKTRMKQEKKAVKSKIESDQTDKTPKKSEKSPKKSEKKNCKKKKRFRTN